MSDQSTGGNWLVNEVKYHINIKEILAVKFALEYFVKEFFNASIKVYTDNTTVVYCTVFANKYGNGTKTEIFDCSPLTLTQKNVWQIDLQGLHTFKLNGC